MEQKDLSVLSLKELRQMLEAITFNQKSEAQVEAKRVVGLREVNEGEKLVEANETSEIILGKVDSETVEKDEEKPNQQEIERVKDLEAEQQLKLQHFSTEEKFEEFVGDSEREQMKVERFSVGPAKPHVFRNVPYINVAARKSNKEMKKGRTVKRTQVRCWRYDKRRRDRWKKELKPSHVVTQRGVREASLCFDGRGWTSQASEEEKGFLFNITQQSIIGLRLFSAQPNYSQIRHLTEINRGALPTMVNSENTKRTEAKAAKRSRWVSKILPSLLNAYTTIRKEEDFGHDEAIGTEKTKNGTAVISTFSHLFDINTTRGGTSFHGIPEFMCFGLIEALFWDVLRKKGVIFLSIVNTAREGGYNSALRLVGVSGSVIFAHPVSPFTGLDLSQEILRITIILGEIQWRDISVVCQEPSLSFYEVLCRLGEFSCLLTIEAKRRQERIDSSLSLAALRKPSAILPTLYDATIPRKGEIRGLANYKWVFEVIFWLSKKDEVACAKAGKDEGLGAEDTTVWVSFEGVVGKLWSIQSRMTIHLQLGIMLKSKSVFGSGINLWVIISSSQGTLVMTFKVRVVEESVEEIVSSMPKVQHEIKLFLLVYTSKHKKLSCTGRKSSMLLLIFTLRTR